MLTDIRFTMKHMQVMHVIQLVLAHPNQILQLSHSIVRASTELHARG